jgi:hypothetical protein
MEKILKFLFPRTIKRIISWEIKKKQLIDDAVEIYKKHYGKDKQ